MKLSPIKSAMTSLFNQAGITPDGSSPWDIQIHNENFYQRVLLGQSLAFGESYMDGWWDSEHLDESIAHILQANLDESPSNLKQSLSTLVHKFINFQTVSRSKKVAEKHYNLGNELYQLMLDSTMNYSCGYWLNAKNLEEAQRNKMELICQKLMLKPGLRVLDIGCGWGSLAKYAAENYGVEVVGVTISEPQKEWAEKKCASLPVKFLLQDYRLLDTTPFDRVVSVGMFEHVGFKNYSKFIDVVRHHLKDEGIFLLHTIGGNISCVETDPWINKYIFPNGMMPSISQIGEAIQGKFIMEDWHNFGPDYDKTLCAWHHNFNAHWDDLQKTAPDGRYDDRFRRMWNYYLLSCAAAFRTRKLQLWQIVLTKHGLKNRFGARELI